MAKKKETPKEKIEREYIIPLREKCRPVPRYKKTPKAIKTIKEFLVRHMKIYDRDLNKIKIDTFLNEQLWRRGIKKPLHKVRVKAVKEGEIVRVYALDLSKKLEFKKARLEKREKKAKEEKEKQKSLMEKAKEQMQGKSKEEASAEASTQESAKEESPQKEEVKEETKTEELKETSPKGKEAKKETPKKSPSKKKTIPSKKETKPKKEKEEKPKKSLAKKSSPKKE